MKRFGEYLVEKGTISALDLIEVLEVQRFQPKKIGRILKDLGAVSDQSLNESLGRFFHSQTDMPIQELKGIVTSGIFSEQFLAFCSRLNVLPMKEDPIKAKVISTVFDDNVVESFEKHFGKEVEVQIIDSESYAFIEGHFKPQATNEKAGIRARVDQEGIFKKSPYSSLFLDLVRDAKKASASDIHIQPTREGVEVRFRVDGDMRAELSLAPEHRLSFINEVKRLSGLSVAVSGKPQDGRVSFNDWHLDLRSSLLPSQFGEKVVLRLLDRTRKFELPVLGFDEDTEHDLREVLEEKSGVAIISGPTGSGKTTTLYTLLSEINRKTRNVLTLEDPIEYSIDGITQVQVSPKLTFAQALRSVLRQDPDVILVGEIRDAETADLCVKAASTGHLVLSTVHANSATDVVGRLLNLGVDKYLLKSVLKLSAAQRLVKKLCGKCSKPLTGSEIANLGRVLTRENYKSASGLRKRNEAGCSECRAGIVGRVSVLEYARSGSGAGLASLFQNETPPEDLAASLQSAYLLRALKGDVDANEYRKIG